MRYPHYSSLMGQPFITMKLRNPPKTRILLEELKGEIGNSDRKYSCDKDKFPLTVTNFLVLEQNYYKQRSCKRFGLFNFCQCQAFIDTFTVNIKRTQHRNKMPVTGTDMTDWCLLILTKYKILNYVVLGRLISSNLQMTQNGNFYPTLVRKLTVGTTSSNRKGNPQGANSHEALLDRLSAPE